MECLVFIIALYFQSFRALNNLQNYAVHRMWCATSDDSSALEPEHLSIVNKSFDSFRQFEIV